MLAAPRHPRHIQQGRKPPSSTGTTPQKHVGRPAEAPSAIVTPRLYILYYINCYMSYHRDVET